MRRSVEDRHMGRELIDWLYVALGASLWAALTLGAVWLHAAVSAGVL